MSASGTFTLQKEERICSKKLIERLFNGGNSHAVTAYPLKVVWTVVERESQMPPVQILISVPKRCFKRAVKRNRVKRQVREAFRKNKQTLIAQLSATPDRQLVMAFIWQDERLRESPSVDKKVIGLLERIGDSL